MPRGNDSAMAETTNEAAGTAQADHLRILFVCTANVCRSPMAGALMQVEAQEHDLPVLVASAGLLSGGREVDRRVVDRVGAGLSGRISRELDEQLVRGADFILAMTADHVLQIVGRFPEAMPRTHTLRHFLKHINPREADKSLFEWAKQSNRAARYNYADADAADDIDDPVDRANAVFDALLVELTNAVGWIGRQISTPWSDPVFLMSEAKVTTAVASGRATSDAHTNTAKAREGIVSFLADEPGQRHGTAPQGGVRTTAFTDLASRSTPEN